MKLFVGNLNWDATEEDVKKLFEEHGAVSSIKIITDRESGRPRGFCFIEMENAEAAMKALDGAEFMGRALHVNEARERERRPHDDRRDGGDRRDYRRDDRRDRR